MNLIYDHGGDIYGTSAELDFSVNTNPFGISEAVKNVYFDSVRLIEKYPDSDCRILCKKIADYENRDTKSICVTPENIFCGNGAADIIYKIIYALRPKTALLTAPTFSEYENALRSIGCGIHRHYLKEENGFVMDGSYLEEKRADIAFICNPNNPTGRAADSWLLRRIAEKCRAEGAVLVIDECFADLADIETMRNDAVVIKAFTKTFAMAGLRLGYVIGDTKIIEKIKRVSPPWGVGSVTLKCAEAAIGDTEYIEASRAFIKSEMRFMYEALNRISGVKAFKSDVNFILFKANPGLYEGLLERGILVRDCSNFEGLGEGFFRVGLKLRKENIRLLEEIEKWQCR